MLLALACDSEERESETTAATVAPIPADPASLQPSEGGLYLAGLRSQDGEVPIGRMHSWVFHVETVEGTFFQPVRLAVSGGMPQHGHGFVTEPRVTRVLGNGDFLVEGVKFHMAGDWTFRFEVVGPAGPDVAIFHVQVDP